MADQQYVLMALKLCKPFDSAILFPEIYSRIKRKVFMPFQFKNIQQLFCERLEKYKYR